MSYQILTRDLVDTAIRIKRNSAAIAFLEPIAAEINTDLMRASVDPERYDPLTVHAELGPETTVYRVFRRTVKPGIRRSGIDHEGLRRAAPSLYRAAVVSKPPAKAFSIHFGQRDGLWQHEAAREVERVRALWLDRTSGVDWDRPDRLSRTLFSLREELRRREAADTELRTGFADALFESGLRERTELRVAADSAKIDARPCKPGFAIDYPMIEARPVGKPFVRYSSVSGYTTMAFVPVTDDPEGDAEPFEGV